MNKSPEIEAQLREVAQRFTKEESAHTATIIQRDLYHDIADELAERIAKITGVEIGEHSSNNDPWMNAKCAADEYLALLPQPPRPTHPEQKAEAAVRSPLSEERLRELAQDPWPWGVGSTFKNAVAFARAVERAHGIAPNGDKA